jgi:glutamyl-Q tRNA(Asp) synthetase
MGSLVTAVASYCEAKAKDGLWLVRIEDLDTPRVVAGSADEILHTLENFGFEWDGQVVYQSQRFNAYDQALQLLSDEGLIYRCQCSRKLLKSKNLASGPMGTIYPGTCRNLHLHNNALSLRLNTESGGRIRFNDLHYGPYELNLSTDVGDIVLKRNDGIYAYHLAVVLDDASQKVNRIVRGADLLEVTCLHLHLNTLFDFTPAQYLHIPLIKNASGQKLSKQTGALAINHKMASQQLVLALNLLGQSMPQDLASAKPGEILQFACNQWLRDRIPRIAGS